MSQEFWLVIAGLAAPLVIQLVRTLNKTMFGSDLSPKAALGWTYAISLVFAVAIFLTEGQYEVPAGDISVLLPWAVAQFTIVLGTATLVYKTLISKSTSVLR